MIQASFVKCRMLRKDEITLYPKRSVYLLVHEKRQILAFLAIWNCLQNTLNRIQMKQACFVKWSMLRKDDVSLYPKSSVYLLVHDKRKILAF